MGGGSCREGEKLVEREQGRSGAVTMGIGVEVIVYITYMYTVCDIRWHFA